MQLPQEAPPDFAAVYRANYGFVWRTVRHLGVDPARVDDAVQDTFLVVYRRLPEFAGRAALRTWLFEIARRVASRYRRSAAREEPRRCALSEAEVVAPAVEAPVEQAEAAAILQGFLDGLDRDQAVVFVMTELEQWQAPEIAAELGVNLNTVYSRLRAARRELDRMVRRLDARDRRARPRQGAHVLAALVVVGPPWPPPWRLAAARDGAVVADMLAKTGSIGPVATPAALAGGSPVVGLSLAGVGLAAVLAFGRPAPPEPAPPVVASLHDPAPAPPPASRERAEASIAAPAPTLAEPLPAAPARRPAARDDEPSLAAELALVESIRAALLAADDRATLELVARHRQRFPAGVFAQEAAAAAIEARCRLGEQDRARREAAAFVARWPASPLAARVTALCRS
ncbi:RNA polymerase sigma factor, sigma-70 family [Nannocystis exedens]|uniref:RNA polymerase sigma factor, sigma-70 family n=1 Tax=Nannocystis exedens TaxID=54 RepID=A0A1I2FYG4_9BACT|nr:sigma-70 family RNA polymerase sigma factor [Nannocystis exedens]PCC74573.1 RNA polymerase sigma factor SigY [Nannocystis exedens]SFF10474.1 RNA polymerase sigma factor, sigma-70 family [Nannocystis exedens]